MNQSKLVSVIVPVYGVEIYLPACVDSLLAQTYRNIEILLVDDGSPDLCPQICDMYEEKDPRVEVFHKQNGGAASARNFGLERASGTYVCFVDGDDVVCETYVASLVENLEKTAADLAVCNYYRLYKSKKVESARIRAVQVISQKRYLLQFLEDWTCSLIWNKLFVRDKIGTIRFAEGHKIDDEFFTYQVVMNCNTVVLFDDPLYEYRMRISSVMGSSGRYEEKILSDRLEYLVERYENVKKLFPDLAESYLRNLMDNLIILLRQSSTYHELNLKVWRQIKKYRWKFLLSRSSAKEKIGVLLAIQKSTTALEKPECARKTTEDYFE